jgi:REP element-mobilizing transposase RayT
MRIPDLNVNSAVRMRMTVSNVESPARVRMMGETPGVVHRKWDGGFEDRIFAVRRILCEKISAPCALFLQVAAMPSVPVAYFVTFRCYGTWPQGDARGWVSRDGGNGPGTPLLPPFPRLAQDGARRQPHPGFWLSAEAREVVAGTIREVAKFRGWVLEALAVRPSHVHVVVRAPGPPEQILSQCKAWSTRRLRESGMVQQNQPAWSGHGSTRYLWDADAVRRANYYVRHEQDDSRVFADPRSRKYKGG